MTCSCAIWAQGQVNHEALKIQLKIQEYYEYLLWQKEDSIRDAFRNRIKKNYADCYNLLSDNSTLTDDGIEKQVDSLKSTGNTVSNEVKNKLEKLKKVFSDSIKTAFEDFNTDMNNGNIEKWRDRINKYDAIMTQDTSVQDITYADVNDDRAGASNEKAISIERIFMIIVIGILIAILCLNTILLSAKNKKKNNNANDCLSEKLNKIGRDINSIKDGMGDLPAKLKSELNNTLGFTKVPSYTKERSYSDNGKRIKRHNSDNTIGGKDIHNTSSPKYIEELYAEHVKDKEEMSSPTSEYIGAIHMFKLFKIDSVHGDYELTDAGREKINANPSLYSEIFEYADKENKGKCISSGEDRWLITEKVKIKK